MRLGAREPPGARELAVATFLLLALGLAVFGTHVVRGGFYSDDWSTADAIRHLPNPGLWEITQIFYEFRGRPVLAFLVNVPHALFGTCKTPHLALALGLGVATAAAFYWLLRILRLGPLAAGAAAALALLFPWADSIRLWSAASINTVAVLLFFLGVVVALRGLRTPGRRGLYVHFAAIVLYVTSLLLYEVATGAILLLILVYALVARWRLAVKRWLLDLIALVASLVYLAATTDKLIAGFGEQLRHVPELGRGAASLFAEALVPVDAPRWIAGVLVAAVLAGVGAVLLGRLPADPQTRLDLRRWLGVSAAGVLGIIAGYAIYVPAIYWTPDRVLGLENRMNIMSAFGYCLAIVGVVNLAALVLFRTGPRRRAAVTTFAAGACVLVAAGWIVQVRDDIGNWDRAARIQQRVLAAIDHAARPPDDSTIYVFGFPAETAQRVPVFYDTWDLNGAARVTLDSRTLRAYPVFQGSKLVCADGFIYPDRLTSPYARLDDFESTGKSQGIRSYVAPYLGGDQGAPYGRILFVDADAGSAELITDRATCEAALARFLPGPFRAAPDGAAAPAAQTAVADPAVREPLTDVAAVEASLPEGFTATVALEGFQYPTAMTLLPDGTLLLGVTDGGSGAAVYAYPALDGGRFGDPVRFAGELEQVTGLLPHGDEVYVAVRGAILALADTNGDLVADERRVLVDDLPAEYPVHANNGLAVGPDGMLYFGVGSTCNACIEPNPLAASILRCRPDGTECAVFARGLRNVYDLAFDPENGALFAADNGAEGLGGATIEIEDEIDVIVEGGNYGWPLCWGIEKGLDCEGTLPALAEIQPHAAPAGLAFYTGTAFPEEYANNLFVTLWGDTGRSVLRVVPILGDDGSYTATVSEFVRMNRPVDVLTAPDGSLLVLDSDARRLYRIAWSP